MKPSRTSASVALLLASRFLGSVAYIGLGANLGQAEDSIRMAIAALDRLSGTRLRAASRLYRTPAWGHQDQPAFVNAVAALDTVLTPSALLDALLALERRFGRQRLAEQRWGPRLLDLDILLYAEQVIDAPWLQVPHPHLHVRAFALLPLAELAPEAIIPGVGTVRSMLAALDISSLDPIE